MEKFTAAAADCGDDRKTGQNFLEDWWGLNTGKKNEMEKLFQQDGDRQQRDGAPILMSKFKNQWQDLKNGCSQMISIQPVWTGAIFEEQATVAMSRCAKLGETKAATAAEGTSTQALTRSKHPKTLAVIKPP